MGVSMPRRKGQGARARIRGAVCGALSPAELASLVHGGPDDPCWNPGERVLLALCDQPHDGCDVSDASWADARAHLSEEALLEVLLLAGCYRTVSYLTNALRLTPEPFAPRFAGAGA